MIERLLEWLLETVASNRWLTLALLLLGLTTAELALSSQPWFSLGAATAFAILAARLIANTLTAPRRITPARGAETR